MTRILFMSSQILIFEITAIEDYSDSSRLRRNGNSVNLSKFALTCEIFTSIIHNCHGTNLCRRMRSGS